MFKPFQSLKTFRPSVFSTLDDSEGFDVKCLRKKIDGLNHPKPIAVLG
jgi:hypothetical protein